MEKKLRAYLPYLLIIGAVYLIAPALLLVGSSGLSYLVLIGLLPLTALLCCAHFSIKKRSDFIVCLFAPLFYLPAMFIYGIAAADLLSAVIYLIAYFLCGYLGLTIGDIIANRRGGTDARPADRRSADRRPEQRRVEVPTVRRTTPARVAVPAEDRVSSAAPRPAAQPAPRRADIPAERPVRQPAHDPYEDHSLDTSTTEDDIDAILREIHQRRSGD